VTASFSSHPAAAGWSQSHNHLKITPNHSEMFDGYLQNLDRKGLATSTINSHDILLNILAFVDQTSWQKANVKHAREDEVKASHFAVFL
jgi:hypothetical protein